MKHASCGALAALALAVAIGGCGKAERVDAGPTTVAVTADLNHCGGPWSAPHGGPVTFVVTNRFREPTDVNVANAETGEVYAELEGIGSGATLKQTVTLGNGSHQLQCFPNDERPALGPIAKVTDAPATAHPTPGVVPVTLGDMARPTVAYQQWVSDRLPTLLAQVRDLAADVRSGATAQAERDWLTAHLTYETLGAAYDAFGPLGEAVNGLASNGETALTDRDLTGFHRIEALLWSGAPAAELSPAVATLERDVRLLIRQFHSAQIDPNIIALRAHEIVENAIELELNATTDAGSHSNLATIGANLQGAAKTLELIAPLLRSRYPALRETTAALASSQRLVARFAHGGRTSSLEGLTTAERQRLNASLEQLVELLAPVAAICDLRSVPAR